MATEDCCFSDSKPMEAMEGLMSANDAILSNAICGLISATAAAAAAPKCCAWGCGGGGGGGGSEECCLLTSKDEGGVKF